MFCLDFFEGSVLTSIGYRKKSELAGTKCMTQEERNSREIYFSSL